MQPTATADEIRHAYRQRARAFHPDRQSGRSAPEQQRAAAEMAALNEAWRVLGDAGRRRQYDRAQAEPVRASRPATTPSPTQVPETDHGADAVTHVVRGAPLLAMLLVLLAIFVITAFAARGAREEPETRGSDGIVEIGSCLALATGQPVVEVPCTEPHDGRAAAIIPLDLSCPADTEYYVAPGGSARVCVDTEELP